MKIRLPLCSMVMAALVAIPAYAEPPPAEAASPDAPLPATPPTELPKPPPPAPPAGPPLPIDIEIYGTLVPFAEYVSTSGSTKPGHTGGADQVPATAYTGAHDRPRLRMTANTSNLGFRGALKLFQGLKVIWQIESAVPIDGNGPPNTIASRNSHIGFGTDYGSLVYGIWDTPYKWQLATSISPLKAGYVTDFTPVISTPGFAVGALNTASGYAAGSPSNAAFHRREANSIQYWSPKVFGFSLRLDYVINEGRNSGTPATMTAAATPGINPWLFSGSLGWEGAGLKISYAYEQHHDYFGMGVLGATSPQPSYNARTSDDRGHDLLATYKFVPNPDFTTRVAATGELLQYKTAETTNGLINQFSRPAFYALLEQSFYQHHVWGAYGQAMQGSCQRVGGAACSTAGLGAKYVTLGYLFAFSDKTNIHLIGYRVMNDASARYATFPALSPIAPGADQFGVGLGFFHSFNVAIIGEKQEPPKK